MSRYSRIWQTSLMLVYLVSAAIAAGESWNRHVIDAGGDDRNGADGIRLGDLNDDGLMDLVVGFEQSGLTRIYLNPGAASVTNPWPGLTLSGTGDVEDAFFVDVDQDGRLDVVTSQEGSKQDVTVHFAPPSGDLLNSAAWSSYKIGAADNVNKWMFGNAANLDGIAGPELIVAGKTDGGPDAVLGWLKAPPQPRSANNWQFNKIADVGWTMSVLLNDLDNDGDEDVIISDRATSEANDPPGVRWFVNPGSAAPTQLQQPWEEKRIGDDRSVMFMDLADLSGDGKMDAISITNSGSRIFWHEQINIATNQWVEREITWTEDADEAGSNKLGKAVRVADVNGDGQLDLVVSFEDFQTTDGVIWLEYTDSVYDGHWVRHDISGPEGDKYDLLQLLDLDGDGDLDVLTTEEGRQGGDQGLGVIWYENPSMVPEPGSFLIFQNLLLLVFLRRR